MYKKTVESFSLLAVSILILIILFTSPQTLGPAGLLVFYLLMYIALLGITCDLLYYGSKFVSKINPVKRYRNVQSLSFRQAYYYAGFISMAPLIFVALSSIGALGIYEIVLTLLFVMLGCFYVSKR